MADHACAVPDCKTGAAEGMLMCRPHWRRVPPPAAAAVWSTWRAWQGRGRLGREEYLEAVRVAVAAVVAYDEAAEGSELLALSVRQPWASAAMYMPDGWKNVENRGWLRAVSKNGMWLAWHAAKVVEVDACAKVGAMWPEMPVRTQLTTGAVLGVVHVAAWVDTYRIDDQHPYAWVLDSRWRDPTYRYAIVIDQRIPLPGPIVCQGGMQLWPLPAAALAACKALVAGVERA